MHRAFFFTDPAVSLWAHIYFFLVGSVVGSFLNVCIYRIPLKQSIVTPRSRCPHCEQLIPWYYNIPVLSYFWLRGRCAYCGESISPVYPLVEFIAAVFFLFLYRHFGVSLSFLIYALFGCSMIILICIDYFHKLLPAVITFPGIAVGLLSSFVNPFVTPVESLVGFLVGGLLPLLVLWIYRIIRKREGLGHGDIVMLAMVGTFLGWKQVLLVLFFSSLIGSLLGGLVIVLFHKGRDYMLPYGSFIGAAALPLIFWGEKIWSLYFH
jgi:leader peptidase (prepilin peptidase)/N-methyltransferase